MRRALALLLLLGACTKAEPKPKAKPRPAPDATPEPGVAARIDSAKVRLVSAKAVAADQHGVAGLRFVLSERDETCATIAASDAKALVFFVPPGPGDHYFVGTPIEVAASSRAHEEEGRGASAHVTMTELDGSAASARVEIDLAATSLQVHGTFDVQLCDPPPLHGLPTEAPATPAAGEYLGKPFALGSVVARVDDGAVTMIDLYGPADMGCTAIPGNWQITTRLPLSPAPGAAQPARLISDADLVVADDWFLPGWARLDAASSTEVTVSVVIAREDGKAASGQLAGTLRATICPPRD